jgi:hypothetical protein
MDEKTVGSGTVRVLCCDYYGEDVMFRPPTALGGSMFARAAATVRPAIAVFFNPRGWELP